MRVKQLVAKVAAAQRTAVAMVGPVRRRSRDDLEFAEILKQVPVGDENTYNSSISFSDSEPNLGRQRSIGFKRAPRRDRTLHCCHDAAWKDWKCAGLHYAIFGADSSITIHPVWSPQLRPDARRATRCLGRAAQPCRMFGLGTGLSLLIEHPFAQYAYEEAT